MAQDGKDRREWTAHLPQSLLDETQEKAADGYDPEVLLYVEEVERFRPAEYADEPLPPSRAAQQGRAAEAGPRFALRVSLKPMLVR